MITRPPLSVATSLGTRNDGADIDWRFLHASPPEETRWTITNPPTPLAFFQLTELIDPADFTVPSLYVSANAPALPDIGADEFVYRIAFPLDTAGHSLVDEASGVAYLTNNATGPLIAVVDDEDRTHFRIYQLNAGATAVVQSFPVSVRNTTKLHRRRRAGDSRHGGADLRPSQQPPVCHDLPDQARPLPRRG